MTAICVYCGRERDEAGPCRGCGAVRFGRDGQHDQREVTRITPTDCLPISAEFSSSSSGSCAVTIATLEAGDDRFALWASSNIVGGGARFRNTYSVPERVGMWIRHLLRRCRGDEDAP